MISVSEIQISSTCPSEANVAGPSNVVEIFTVLGPKYYLLGNINKARYPLCGFCKGEGLRKRRAAAPIRHQDLRLFHLFQSLYATTVEVQRSFKTKFEIEHVVVITTCHAY